MTRSEKNAPARGDAAATACHAGALHGPQVYSVDAPTAPRIRACVPPMLVESVEGA